MGGADFCADADGAADVISNVVTPARAMVRKREIRDCAWLGIGLCSPQRQYVRRTRKNMCN